jgi:hypothetical protein
MNASQFMNEYIRRYFFLVYVFMHVHGPTFPLAAFSLRETSAIEIFPSAIGLMR